jgi:hypothetical protein
MACEMDFAFGMKCISCTSFCCNGGFRGDEVHFVYVMERESGVLAQNAKMKDTKCTSLRLLGRRPGNEGHEMHFASVM